MEMEVFEMEFTVSDCSKYYITKNDIYLLAQMLFTVGNITAWGWEKAPEALWGSVDIGDGSLVSESGDDGSVRESRDDSLVSDSAEEGTASGPAKEGLARV
jgi:hypothetical protein